MKIPAHIALLFIVLFISCMSSFRFKPAGFKNISFYSNAVDSWENEDSDAEKDEPCAPELLDYSDYFIDPYMYNYSSHQYICAANVPTQTTA